MGIQNNLKIGGSAHISQAHSSVNKVQPNLCLPGWSCLHVELSLIMLLLKQKMFLGVPSVVRMTTR